ncbi:hypothetical protein OS493_039572, partial [Desmophyllum pertusum]
QENSCTVGNGQAYAVIKNKGRIYGTTQGFKHNGVLTAIKEAKQGDLDAIRDFEIKDGEGKKKRRAITFRRTAIPLPPKGKLLAKLQMTMKSMNFKIQERRFR